MYVTLFLQIESEVAHWLLTHPQFNIPGWQRTVTDSLCIGCRFDSNLGLETY